MLVAIGDRLDLFAVEEEELGDVGRDASLDQSFKVLRPLWLRLGVRLVRHAVESDVEVLGNFLSVERPLAGDAQRLV